MDEDDGSDISTMDDDHDVDNSSSTLICSHNGIGLQSPLNESDSDDRAPAYSPIQNSHTLSTPIHKNTQLDDMLESWHVVVSPDTLVMQECEEEGTTQLSQPQPQTECSQGAVELVPETQEENIIMASLAWDGYKSVGDNLDKIVKPRYMTMTQSRHFFNTYAVKDRINLSTTDFSGFHNGLDPDINLILPSTEDQSVLMSNFSVLAARILVQNMLIFKCFEDVIEKHIQHEYSCQLSTKSEIVSETCTSMH